MAFIKLTFKPGVNRDQTNYAGEGGWFACNRIRFRSSSPQNIGGWIKTLPQAFFGICRQMHNWITTFNDNLLAIGTNNKLYLEFGSNIVDITPLRENTPTIGPPNTNNAVFVYNTSFAIDFLLGVPHNANIGDFVTVLGVVGPIGGIPASVINGNHQITDISSATVFRITSSVAATANVSAAGGTAITLDFEILPGFPVATNGYGWGVGPWGRNGWGTGATTPIALPQRDWWFDNFDNDLVANIRNGPIYWWSRGTLSTITPVSRAVLLSDLALADGFDPDAVPVKVMQVLVSQQDKILIALGAVPFGSTDPADFDPLLIRWADQDNPTQWTPTPTNAAGFLRVSRGSRIIRGLPTRQEILIWTDAKLYALQSLGTADVFGLQEYADNISIMSGRSVITAANITFWMGQDKFYTYTGRVDTLFCTLRDHVFNNLDLSQAEQVVCGTNEEWNEVWWFYPTNGSDYNNAYVIYNHLDQLWYYGEVDRTAWLDSPMRQVPLACKPVPGSGTGIGAMSFLMSHEVGVDDDTLPLNSFITSNDFDLGDGDNFMLTRRIIPDISFEGSPNLTPQVTLQVFPRNFPGDPAGGDADETAKVISNTIDTYTDQVFMRTRARQMAVKIMADQLGVNWQLGVSRLDLRQDGRR